MIQKSKQMWESGEIVKVGFMKLQVIEAKSTKGDYKPDSYLLSNGKKYYVFVPHNGLTTLCNKYCQPVKDIEEAQKEFAQY